MHTLKEIKHNYIFYLKDSNKIYTNNIRMVIYYTIFLFKSIKRYIEE